MNATFPADVFNVAFYGNANYAGESAKLSPFNLNAISYQQLEIGFVCTNVFGKAKLGVGVSFLAGQQLQQISMSLQVTCIQTHSDNTFNSIQTQNIMRVIALPVNTHFNGYGASLDVYFSMPYKLGTKNGDLTISVSDLGFIKWNSKSLTYNKDTSFTYSGITINSLNHLQNAAINNL